ncbi:DUF751 domain-containing protein [Candidatus Cyanaurora vandensis]|uniref:DUF751 domain-containing protein n=1 Tax=Candidatus Cyanaurora vandensis TaxID=2714958 RepID=UPI00257D1818|nr:DUF751 domain-containing protein [Candidatus Cyanaurora vandensis]
MGDFIKSISKWPVFLAGSFLNNVMGTFGWVAPLWRNPVTAFLLVLALIGSIIGLVLTLRAMLSLG